MSFSFLPGFRLSLVFGLSFYLLSCGPKTSVIDPFGRAREKCDDNVAVIAVGEGFLREICGCGGAPGRTVQAPEEMTCSITRRHALFFQFFGALFPHQFVEENQQLGTVRFDPERSFNQSVYSLTNFRPGTTYRLRDLHNGMSVKIDVQP